MTHAEIEELKKLAQDASQGKWTWEDYDVDNGADCLKSEHGYEVLFPFNFRIEVLPRNADYISAANPTTILALIERLERYERALEFYADDDNYEKFNDTYATTNSSSLEYETTWAHEDRGKRAREAMRDGAEGERDT